MSDNNDLEEDGGYDVKFVDQLPEFLQCIICHLALKKPVQVSECGHRYCQSCFEKIKKYANDSGTDLQCPMDRFIIEDSKVFSDKGIERFVLDLSVKCSNSDSGCFWTGELRALEEKGTSQDVDVKNQVHADNACPFKIMTCPQEYCDEKLQRSELKKHIESCVQKGKTENGSLLESIAVLTCKLNDLDNKMKEKDSALRKMENDLYQTQNELANLKNRFAEHLPNCSQDSNPDLNPTSKSCAAELSHGYDNTSNQVQFNVNGLMRVLNVLTKNNPIFTWTIRNYLQQSMKGNRLFSPPFYTSLYGNCVRLFMKWFGRKKDKVGLFLIVYDNESNPSANHFCKVVNLRCSTAKITVLRRVLWNYDHYVRHGEENECPGFGLDNFLQFPQHIESVVDNSLTVECWFDENIKPSAPPSMSPMY